MLVPLDGYQEVWHDIKRESLSHSTYRVVIFVSCMDVDAFVAAYMLSSLLKKHLILYKTEPVCGYESLQTGFSRLDKSIRNVFFIGCGASVDLEDLLELNYDGNTRSTPKIHIFDKKRPWHLNNLFGSDLVYCYEDSNSDDMEEYKSAYQFLASNIEEDDDNTGDVEPEKKLDRKIPIDDDDDDYNKSEETNEDEYGGTQEDMEQIEDVNFLSLKKKRKTQKESYIKLLEDYYCQGSHIVSTDAVQIYTLLSLVGETNSMMLWLAVVGLTSIEVENPQLYKLLLPTLKDEMHRFNQASITTQPSASSSGIRFYSESDFSLFLLRQWSLYESMIHSSYVSAKLFLWREDGRKKLHKMLARVGITLEDAKELWMHTKPVVKRELKQRLESISGSYGIEGITRDGIVRQFGLSGAMSAGDCVESIAAYLEMGQFSSNSKEDTYIGEQTYDINKEVYEAWVRNFWVAWDSIDNFDKLKNGCEQAKLLQKAVVQTANFVFDKNLPKDLRSFRMVIVQDAPAIHTFYNPLSLQRLANWISEGCAEIHSSNTPFVLVVLDERRDVYLVIGMANHRSRDADEIVASSHNHFGRQFRNTAAKINAEVKMDAFESSIIEVFRSDLPRFLEALDAQMHIS